MKIKLQDYTNQYSEDVKALFSLMLYIDEHNDFDCNSSTYVGITQKDLDAYIVAFVLTYGRHNKVFMDRNTTGKLEAWYSREWDAEAKMFCPQEDYISDKLEIPMFEMYLVAHCAAYYGKDAAIKLLVLSGCDYEELNMLINRVSDILDNGIPIYNHNEEYIKTLKLV